MTKRIYLDNNASAPLDPRIADFLVHLLSTLQGNPSSSHSFGQKIRGAIAQTRHSIATFLGVKPSELTFTSGGTASVNTIMRGIASTAGSGHLITSSVEHSCVFETAKFLESSGFQVTFLKPGSWGAITPEAVAEAIRPDTKMIALMAANNETGVKTDINAIAAIAHSKGIPFFVDAVAVLGKETLVMHPGVTAMAFSGHKIHAPQGIGLSYIRAGTKIPSLLKGGGQEMGRRGGTENVIGILCLGKAFELLSIEQLESISRMEALRNRFEEKLGAVLSVMINGEGPRIANVSNLSFEGVDGETLLMALDGAGIAASHGSACASGSLEPSRVLTNMGLPLKRVRSSIRFSLGHQTTEADIDSACNTIISIVHRLKH
jgi:cysteine desulfurase